MDSSEEKNYRCPVGEPDCHWLQELANLQLQVNELTELVSHDQLTGLYNFRHFSELLPRVLERARRSSHPSSVIMLDLDHFKNINDTWGHEVGNIALQQAARIILQQIRMIDIACRYGGEEFVIILPDTALRQAVQVAERIRLAIAQTPLVIEQGEFSFTASMGVDVFSKQNPLTAEQFMDSVDKLLYEAKNTGRNRTCHRDFAELEKSTSVSQSEKEALSDIFDSNS